MDTKIFALLVLVGVLGSFMEAQATYFGYPHAYGNGRLGGPTSVNFVGMSRSKREIGETTTSQATTMTPSSTNPTTTPSSTTSLSSTTPSPTTSPTSPTTTPSTSPITTPTTTEATSPTTTPTSTSATTPSTTSATTPSTTDPSMTTSESTKSTSKPKKSTDNDVLSRSNFDESEPEDSSKKPGSSSKSDKMPTPGPYYGPGVSGTGFGSFGPGFDPYNGYPGFNSIPGPGPNYAWTGTNNGPGYASAGASAGSFAGGYPGYPGAGYPGAGYPGAGYSGARYPGAGYPMRRQPTPTTTESPSVNNRGGFQDNSPNQNTPNYGRIDPYNAGPGFFFPGQFPTFNDPTFDMIRQIQAQIEAQHQANMEAHNRLASEAANYGSGSYGGGGPQVASASIGLGPDGGYQIGQISPVAPGIESRFADDLPAPSGNSFGVFASSSSSSRTGPDGRPIGHKTSITGVNDNGKISYRTVHD